MATIGVRELKQHTSQVLRRVRERGEEIVLPRPRRPRDRRPLAQGLVGRLRLPLVAWDTEQRD